VDGLPGKSAIVAVSAGQCLPSLSVEGTKQFDLYNGADAHDHPRSTALRKSDWFLVSLAPGGEDVVEAFLLSPILFLIVSFPLLIEHLDNRF